MHLLRVVLSMSGSWLQARQPKAVQQIVDSRQAVTNAELLFDYTASVFASEAANAIVCGRTAEHPLAKLLLVDIRQLRGPSGLSLRSDRIYPVITVGIYPSLHEVLAAAEHLHNSLGLPALQSQQHGSIAVPLFGIALFTDSVAQLLKVFSMVRLYLHLTIPLVFLRVCQII